MDWMDVMDGEVRARREDEEFRRAHADHESALRSRRVEAAMSFVIGNELERLCRALNARGLNGRVEGGRGSQALTLIWSAGAERTASLSFVPDHNAGVVILKGAGVESGEGERWEAAAISPVRLRRLLQSATGCNGA